MTQAPPRVSVVIPCYKQASFLPEAVESLVAQTYADWECIVVDDGSPDDTAKVADALVARHGDRRIRLIRQSNKGLSEARNAGIREARGRYILPLDSDDRLAPAMLEKLVRVLDEKADVSIAFTHAQCFGTTTGVWRCGPLTLDRIRVANQIPYCSLYRRSVWDAVGGYNPNLDAYEDWDFWIGAVERGFRAEGIDEALFQYRTKAQSMLTEAEARKPQLVARVTLNHPGLFSPEQEAEARKILRYSTPERRAPWVPAVSVVVASRAGGDALARTLASVLEQTAQDFEVVLVCHGEARSEGVVTEADCGGRVHYLRLARATGRGAARNAAVRMARGRWIAYADEGDILAPDHLASLVAALRESGAAVAYGDVANGEAPAPRTPVACVMHERRAFELAGGFDETAASDDSMFPARLIAAAKSVHVKRVVTESGLADAVSMAKSMLRSGNVRAATTMLEAYVRRVPDCADAHNDLAVLYHSLGDSARSLASIVRALELQPNSAEFRQNALILEKAVVQNRRTANRPVAANAQR
jgi:glycosyltransferase involved in cell wall biosynthesis